MNGLKLDIHKEEKAIEMFAQNVLQAGNDFLDNPMETPFIPSWNRVVSAIPDVQEKLLEAVELDMQEFS
jgi:glucosyl-3-phosphoglycerate synthase